MNAKVAAASGFLLGTLSVFFLDRNHGSRRRSFLRDKLVHYGLRSSRIAGRKARHAKNKTSGWLARRRERRMALPLPELAPPRSRSSMKARLLKHPLAWQGSWGRPMHVDETSLDPLTAARMTDHNVR